MSRQRPRIPRQAVLDAIAAHDGPIDTASLYPQVLERAGLPADAIEATRAPVGRSGQRHSLVAREIRFRMQDLRRLGLIENTARGQWRATVRSTEGLTRLVEGFMPAFSTRIGAAYWGDCSAVFAATREQVALVLTSPPFPLARARDYGNSKAGEFVDFVSHAIEPLVRQLVPGGSIVLHLGNDIFNPGRPSRSSYVHRVVVALEERFGLELMDTIPWVVSNRAPGPTLYACREPVQLASRYDPMLWFTNDALRVRSNNRRVPEPMSERQRRFVAAGGEQREASFGNGAHRIRPGAFAGQSDLALPGNIVIFPHSDAATRRINTVSRALGLPQHGAPMPLELAQWFVRFLTEREELVVDPFGGTAKVALAAESLGRRWMSADLHAEYLYAGASEFECAPGFALSADFNAHVWRDRPRPTAP